MMSNLGWVIPKNNRPNEREFALSFVKWIIKEKESESDTAPIQRGQCE